MPQGRFNEYSAQEQAAMARQWLQSRGLPMTADNLNRAMLSLMQGDVASPIEAETRNDVMNRALTRSMAPRTDGVMAEPLMPPAAEPTVVDEQPETQQEAAQQRPQRRRGTVNNARRIDEENPNEGFETGRFADPDAQRQIANIIGMIGLIPGGPLARLRMPNLGIILRNRRSTIPQQLQGPSMLPPAPPGPAMIPSPSPQPLLPGPAGAAVPTPTPQTNPLQLSPLQQLSARGPEGLSPIQQQTLTGTRATPQSDARLRQALGNRRRNRARNTRVAQDTP